ncbi:hypothetical protein CEXT_478231 [Caerostris extrusa]|uniref:Uncharacterized protein n=1 Tax=Caerostris extrusa TaxID=172846 RepID=A0AAV4Y4E2_CAEEX|nr:hypothetical protein CEXT_478231 [Caerostris extrusa]
MKHVLSEINCEETRDSCNAALPDGWETNVCWSGDLARWVDEPLVAGIFVESRSILPSRNNLHSDKHSSF